MRRRLLNLLTALSLVLSATTCALWVRSDYVGDMVTRRHSPDGHLTSKWYFLSERGQLSFSSAVEPDDPADGEFYFPGPPAWDWESYPNDTLPAQIDRSAGFWRALGFDWHWDKDALDDGYRWRTIGFPVWLPAAGFAFAPAAAACRRYVRSERSRRGHCRRCGYDLTGNVSGVCPECGSPQD